MKILITGGTGFIGSHISRLLLDSGHQVIIYDNLSKSSKKELDPRAKFIKADLSEEKLLTDALTGCDGVIHLASLIEVPESIKEPLLFAKNNILGTIHLLEAMQSSNTKKIIFSSSACVYGQAQSLPITEQAPISSTNPYGACKVAAEQFIQSYQTLYDFDAVILRYFNPYGPGERHQPETHAIPNFIQAALNKKPIPLYWKGEQIRDFIYIEDLSLAHITALTLSGHHIFNIGSEKGIKVIDVVKILSDILGYNLEIEDLGERKGDVMANYASSKLLKQKTGWEAKVSLEEGLKKTVDWFKNRD